MTADRISVADARKDLVDRLHDLACTVRDWQLYPESTTQRDAAREALTDAEAAFTDYASARADEADRTDYGTRMERGPGYIACRRAPASTTEGDDHR